MKQTVYLICGVSGSGKSWVCERVKHLAYYHSTDLLGYKDPTRTVEIHDRTTNISTSIKRLRNLNIIVIPIFVLGDFIQVKSQLLKRGGKVTANLYRRWKRVKSLSKRFGIFSGSSYEVLLFLKNELKHRDIEHIIYRVTSPSGRVYIGKTNQTLEKRQYDHEWYSKNHDSLFSRAIKKYGDKLIWEQIDKTKGLQSANDLEQYWISYYKSNLREYGYNSTEGGDGGKKSLEAENKRVEAIQKAYLNPDLKDKIRVKSKQKWQDQSYKDKVSSSIKKTRSSEESKAKTRKQMDILKTDKKWLENISKKSIEANARPEVKAKLSSSLKKAKAKQFEVKKDGKLIGYFFNQADASIALNLKSSSISRCLGGFLKQTGGYTFRYLDTDSIVDRIGGSYEENNECSSSSNNE